MRIEYRALMTYSYKGKGPVLRKKDTAEEIKSKIIKMQFGKLPFLLRFPQGVSPDLLEALLAAYGQDTVILVREE